MALPERIKGRVAAAPVQFANDKFSLLAMDADSAIYQIAATTNSIETAKRRFVLACQTIQLLSNADSVEVHLTPKHCTKAGRFKIKAQKPYQANREGAKKPALVEPLRYAVGRKQLHLPDNFELVFNDTYEADDSVIMSGVKWGDECVIYSLDKDLLCTRNRMLCPETNLIVPGVPMNSVGTLMLKELSSTKKSVGRGPLFFWAQMLMGDHADNIKGITKVAGKLCGPARTVELLEQFIGTASELRVAMFVLRLYMENKQNPWPEAWLLWLYPRPGYTFKHHLKALGMLDRATSADTELTDWLNAQWLTDWFERG